MAVLTMPVGLAELSREVQRQKKRQEAAEMLWSFEGSVVTQTDCWTIAARNIGSAYSLAYTRHCAAVDNWGKAQLAPSLEKMLLLGILGYFTGPAFAWVVEAKAILDKAEKIRLLFETALGVKAKYFAPYLPADSPNSDPLTFQNRLENRISSFLKAFREMTAREWDGLRQLPDQVWDSWDAAKQRAAYDRLLKEIQEMKGMARTNDKIVADLADDLEKYIWANWIPRLRRITSQSLGGSSPGWSMYEYSSVSSPFTASAVESRLSELGILEEAGVKIKWLQDAGIEVEKLIDWAHGYTPEPWVPKE
jgi:hypothetical protein